MHHIHQVHQIHHTHHHHTHHHHHHHHHHRHLHHLHHHHRLLHHHHLYLNHFHPHPHHCRRHHHLVAIIIFVIIVAHECYPYMCQKYIYICIIYILIYRYALDISLGPWHCIGCAGPCHPFPVSFCCRPGDFAQICERLAPVSEGR